MRHHNRHAAGRVTLFLTAVLLLFPIQAMAAGNKELPGVYATFWALVPPIAAILLALLTKEVYSSLFIGILVGGLFYSGFSIEGTLTHVLEDGFLSVLSNRDNAGILMFLVVLGAMVSLINRAGGSAVFGNFAIRKIKTRAGAQCNHVNHVTTQLPYIIVAASVSFVTYVVAGFVQSAWISLPVGLLLGAVLIVIKKVQCNTGRNQD